MEPLGSKMKEGDKKATQGKSKPEAGTIKIQDRILLQQAIENRDKGAIHQIYTIYYLNIKRYIASRVNSIEDVEDLTQSVFLEFFRKDDAVFKQYRSTEAFLLKIARDCVALYYRNRNNQPNTISIESIGDIADSNIVKHYQDTPKSISLQELKKIFEIVELPSEARQALTFKFIKKYSTQKSAQKARCSVWAFYKRVDKAMKLLEDQLKKRY